MRDRRRLRPILLLAGTILIAAAATASASDRMERHIRAFEQGLNTMLIDSPNFLVSSREPAQGTYVEGHGVVFSFRVSLVSDWDHGNDWWDWFDRHDRHDRRWKEEVLNDQARRYEKGKDELYDTILTFGELLSSLPRGEEIDIRIRLRSAPYFRAEGLRKLRVRVAAGDLAAFYDGRLSESELFDRFRVDED